MDKKSMEPPVIDIPHIPAGAFSPNRPENENQEYQVAALLDSINRTVKEKVAANPTEGAVAKIIGTLTVALESLNG